MSDDTRPSCRSCGHDDLDTFLDLGETPLADALVRADALADDEDRFPLEVAFCSKCALVQITHEVPAERLFVDNYLYFSSFSDHLLTHSAAHARNLIDERALGPDSFVVELASNDGYLLKNFVEAGIPVLGIDPSPGPAKAAIEAGIPTLVDFFGRDLAVDVVADHGLASVVIANNVLAHVPDLNGFVDGIATILAPDGVVTIENPTVQDLIDHCEFDTIYHEHFCYYSCLSIDALMDRHGLHLNDVEYFADLHGGTLRWHVSHRPGRTDRLERRLADEQGAGLGSIEYYRDFSDRVAATQRSLLELLGDLRDAGKRVAGYGAAAKGATLLNSTGIGLDLVEYVVDRNVHKQGYCMPGTHQPVLDPSALVDDRPDAVLLLAWNFADEIVRQQSGYLDLGGRFIVPVPEPRFWDSP